MNFHSTAWRFPVKALWLALLVGCVPVPHQEHYRLRSDYYRALVELNEKHEVEKAALRERIAFVQSDQGRDEGRRLQLEGETGRLRADLEKTEKRLAKLAAESERDAKAAKVEIEAAITDNERLKKELETTRSALAAATAIRETTVVVLDNVLFAAGSKTLTKEAKLLLKSAVDALSSAAQISVVGYTDDIEARGPAYFSPWTLSAARASEVVVFLVTELQIMESRVTPVGRGSLEEKAPNDSPTNRARNRRVEIIAIYR